MKPSEINRWWQRAMAKEQLRANHPKAPKHQRLVAPTDSKIIIPSEGRARQR